MTELSTENLIEIILNDQLDRKLRRNALEQLASKTTPMELKALLKQDIVLGRIAFKVWAKPDSGAFQELCKLLGI